MLKRFTFFLFIFFFSSIALAQGVNNPYLNALPNWQNVLTKHVDDQGRINFWGVVDDPDDLIAFVSAIQQVSPETHKELFTNREQILSYHVNAYNALAMYGVLDRGIPKNFSSLRKRASFFRFRKVIIGGKKTNLYHYENKVIRPYCEPRMHFALNCMVKDCPRLPKQAFTEQNLEEMLQASSVEFLNREKYVALDPVSYTHLTLPTTPYV